MDKKVERIIKLYSRFLDGKIINKKEEAQRFEVNQRTIQRDIDDIRMCFANDMNVNWQIVYDRNKKGYMLLRDSKEQLNSQEILVLCKAFLQSRLLVKDEMFPIIDKLVQICLPNEDRKKISSLLAKEKMYYEEPVHGKQLQGLMKDINDAIYTQRMLQIKYLQETDEDSIWQVVQPIGVICSGNNFYLTVYDHVTNELSKQNTLGSDKNPMVYRLDKILEYKVLKQHFHIPYSNQYEKSDFWKLIEEEVAVSKEKI